jgi:hypothetical protein
MFQNGLEKSGTNPSSASYSYDAAWLCYDWRTGIFTAIAYPTNFVNGIFLCESKRKKI